MESQKKLKLDHVGSKTRSLDQIIEKLCVRSGGHIFNLMLMKPYLNVCLIKISKDLKIDHVCSKTRSLGQIIEKPCVRSRGHILSVILMESGQNVCLDKILYEIENESRQIQKLGHYVKS